MKSVLFSIKPRWCELIASGLKRDEIRKTSPKEVPFKGYIYCTKEHDELDRIYFFDRNQRTWCNPTLGNGKVIGEFICNSVTDIIPNDDGFGVNKYVFEKEDVRHCVPFADLKSYLGSKIGKDLELSDVVIYDEPKPLSEFGLNRAPQSWCYVEEVTE